MARCLSNCDSAGKRDKKCKIQHFINLQTRYSGSARRYGVQKLVFVAPFSLNWMRIPGKEEKWEHKEHEKCAIKEKFNTRGKPLKRQSLMLLRGTFKKAVKAKCGKDWEDVDGVPVEWDVHCLAFWNKRELIDQES